MSSQGQLREVPKDWHIAPADKDARTWAGAVALAYLRHANAPYPQPCDEIYAETVLRGADLANLHARTAWSELTIPPCPVHAKSDVAEIARLSSLLQDCQATLASHLTRNEPEP
jgi:hypothetical protein